MSLARELSFRFPMQRGADVRAVQQALIRAGELTGAADGIFGPRTRDAVLRFQQRMRARDPASMVDGIVGRQTWSALFPDSAAAPVAPGLGVPAAVPAGKVWRAALTPYVARLIAGSAPPVGQGARRWRLTPKGVRFADQDALPRTPGEPVTARGAWQRFRRPFETCAAAYGVPVELLVATACTESRARPEAVREEPGFISDTVTPHRVSPGLMQTLIETAQHVLRDPSIDRARLLDPETSIRAGAAVIRWHAARLGTPPTHFDPPLVAIAYNAGTLRPRTGVASDPWGLVQTGRGGGRWHADSFCEYFNDLFAVFVAAPETGPGPRTPSFWALLQG